MFVTHRRFICGNTHRRSGLFHLLATACVATLALPAWSLAQDGQTSPAGSGPSRTSAKPTDREIYVTRFKQLQVLAAGDDWVVAVRDGRKISLNHNEVVGPAQAFLVRVMGGKLILYDRLKGVALADVDLHRKDEATAASAVMIRDTSSSPAPLSPPKAPEKSAVIALGMKSGAADPPQNIAFPYVRLPQVLLYETSLGSALRFLVRDQERLSVDISDEDAEEIVPAFQIRGNFRLTISSLSETAGMFIVREGDSLIVRKLRAFKIINRDGFDASEYIDKLRQLGARNISLTDTPPGVRFEMDKAAWMRMNEWIMGVEQ
jgi:hypothetical protein